jgi:cytochrome P450
MVKYIKQKVKEIVDDRRIYLQANKKDPAAYDLLDIMLTSPIATNQEGKPVYMSSAVVEFNLITILSAGQATTTSLLSWSLYYLFDPTLGGANSRYKLIQEVDAISRGDRSHTLTVSEMYTKLHYMTQCFFVSPYSSFPFLVII